MVGGSSVVRSAAEFGGGAPNRSQGDRGSGHPQRDADDHAAPGVRLRGGTLRFGAKGVRLTRDNVVEGVTVLTADHEVAILNDTTVADLGTLTLRDVRTTGQVLLLAEDAVRSGHVGSRD